MISVAVFIALCLLLSLAFPGNDLWYFLIEKYHLLTSCINPFRPLSDEPGCCTSDNLCVVSHDTRDVEFVREYRARNEAQCAKQGITFKFYGADACTDVPVFWRKIHLVEQALQHYDYVMWIDADAHITDTMPIVQMINLYDTAECALMVSKDARSLWNLGFLNAGVFIAKRRHKHIFDTLIDRFNTTKSTCWASPDALKARTGLYSKWCYEQGALNRLYFDHPGKVVPLSTFHVTPFRVGPQTVVVHYMGNTKNNGLVSCLGNTER